MINIYIKNIIKNIIFIKIFYLNLNILIDLFNRFFIYIKLINKINLYFYKEIINIFHDLYFLNTKFIKKINYKKYSLYQQKKNININFNNYYIF